ncbi:acyl-CoA thioesterase [uncultured Nocardioides sp.]|uniref:acyl-CoA thioesterase n=1 Tax=uncultured Nocardioides sp. TaxID=198441 RepID=UPI00260CE14B|nr:acyl-CoA thioesterase [uncultured Nocardioides sp.]
MRHVYECPLRWADLDLLGHVNNVAHVDVLQEARIDMLRSHGATPDGPAPLTRGSVVVRLEVSYVAPLRLRRHVRVEMWTSEVRAGAFTLDYEVTAGRSSSDDTEREVVLRARTLLAPYDFDADRPRRLTHAEREGLSAFLEPGEPVRRARPSPGPAAWTDVPTAVRFSDVDVFGHVNNVAYVELFQEARIRTFSELMAGVPEGTPPMSVVVARTDVDYLRPVLFRGEPYRTRTRVEEVRRTSFVLVSELDDPTEEPPENGGPGPLARARVVVVGFDPEAQRAAVPPAPYLEVLRSRLTP